MITGDRKAYLEALSVRATVAGDDYCFAMSPEDFAEEFDGAEDMLIYKEFVRQRELGVEAYAEAVKQELAQITSSAELHALADNHNYDDGTFLPEQVVTNPACALETAQEIFWLSAPDYYYDKFGGPEHCDESYNKPFADLLVTLINKASTSGFQIGTGVVLSEEMTSYIKQEQLDYTKEPYQTIPDCFRV